MGIFEGAGRGVVHGMYASWIVFLVLFSGCTQRSLRNEFGMFREKFDVTNVYSTEASKLNKVARVGIMPITSRASVWQGTLDAICESFCSELFKQLKFEAIKISNDELLALFGKTNFVANDIFPNHFFSSIKQSSDVDAVLFIDITHYEPYKPVAIGVKCKLISTESAKILWAVDELFDSGIPSVQTGISEYVAKNKCENTFFSFDDTFVYSPLKFSYYVAHEIFNKLPNNF